MDYRRLDPHPKWPKLRDFLNVEVLADRYEVLAALSQREYKLSEGAETDEETDDLPF